MDKEAPTFTFSRRAFLGGCAAAGAGLFVAGGIAGANLDLFDLRTGEATPPDPPPPPPPGGHTPPLGGSALRKISDEGVLTRLAILSDLHYTHRTPAIEKFTVALGTLGWVAPGIDAFFLLGDVSLNGADDELEVFATETAEHLQAIYPKAPLMHVLMGNHDYWEGSQKSFEALFKNHVAASQFVAEQNTVAQLPGASIIKLNGLGSYETDKMDYTMQYDFLKQALDEASSNRPDDAILVMSHEPPLHMELPEDFECGLYGQGTSKDLVELMQRYPQVRMFSGHIHNNLDRGGSINTDLGFTSVHTSTIGSCYFYKGHLEDKKEIGSQGILLDIMEDKRLVVHLLDFDRQEQLGEPVEL